MDFQTSNTRGPEHLDLGVDDENYAQLREGSGNARKAKAPVCALEESEECLLSPHSYPLDLPHHASAPMSACSLFSRQAAPISLPELDRYILRPQLIGIWISVPSTPIASQSDRCPFPIRRRQPTPGRLIQRYHFLILG